MDGAQWHTASHILLQMASSQVQANMVTYNTWLVDSSGELKSAVAGWFKPIEIPSRPL